MKLTNSPHYRAEYHRTWEPKPLGKPWATPGLLRESFTFTLRLFSNFSLTSSLMAVKSRNFMKGERRPSEPFRKKHLETNNYFINVSGMWIIKYNAEYYKELKYLALNSRITNCWTFTKTPSLLQTQKIHQS